MGLYRARLHRLYTRICPYPDIACIAVYAHMSPYPYIPVYRPRLYIGKYRPWPIGCI